MATLDAELDELGDAGVERLERVGLENLLVEVQRDEGALDVVAGVAKAHLREVVGAEGEEVGVLADLVGGDGGARNLDHAAHGDVELDAGLLGDAGDDALDLLADDLELLDGSDEGNHNLGLGVKAALLEVGGSGRDGANLHLGELGVDDAQAAAAQAEHGVGLLEGVQAGEKVTTGLELDVALAAVLGVGELDGVVARVVQELVQGRVKQADDDGLAVHGLEHTEEVVGLDLQQLAEGLLLSAGAVGQDEGLDDLLAVAQEHVLGAVETDALGAEVAGQLGVLGVVSVGADAEDAAAGGVATDLVGPLEDGLEVAGELGAHQGHGAQDDVAGGAVDGDDVALVEHDVGAGDGDLLGLGVDLQGLGAADAGGAHATGDDGGVAGLATVAGQDALGGDHALEVVRRGLPAHEDAGLVLVGAVDGLLGGEDDLAHGGARGGVHALGEDLEVGLGVELRVQELVELLGGHAHDGLLAGDGALGLELHGDGERGHGGALAHAGLEHPELALLDGELDVHHVVVVLLELDEDLVELLSGLLEARDRLEVGDGLGVADTGHDVLALGVDQEVAVELLGAVGGVAGEGDAGRGGLALVTKDHDLDVDGGAEVVGDLVLLAVDDGALVHPAAEDGLDGKTQLQLGVLREGGAAIDGDLGVSLGVDVDGEDLLEGLREVLQVLGGELGVELDALLGLLIVDGVLEEVTVNAHDDVGEHLDEAAVGVPGKALVAGLLDEAVDGDVVEAEVEDGVHHAGHGERGAGADGDQQRVLGVAQLLAHALLEVLAGGVDLVQDAVSPDVASVCVGNAGLAGDGESRRNGKANLGHLGKVGALAADDPLCLVDGLAGRLGGVDAVNAGAKAVHVLFSHFVP